MVTTRQIAETYGLKINKQGFTNCIIHNEKTASMKIYSGDRGFYCFGCGRGGNNITLVSRIFNIDTKEAYKKILNDFEYGAIRIDRNEMYFARWSNEAKALFNKYIKVLRRAITELEPKTASDLDSLNMLYVFALHNYDLADYYYDCLYDNPLEFYNKHKEVINFVKRGLSRFSKAGFAVD